MVGKRNLAWKRPVLSPVMRAAACITLIALAYFAACRVAFFFPDAWRVLAAVWPAGGIGLAALLLSPRRRWPAIGAALFVAGSMADFSVGRPLFSGLGFVTANVLESLGCAWLIVLWCGENVTFRTVKEIAALICAATAVNACTAALGAGMASVAAVAPFWGFWQTRSVSDGLGILLVTPLIVTWSRGRLWPPRFGWRQLAEFVGLAACLCVLASLSLGGPPGTSMHDLLPYLVAPLLAVIALRLGQRGVTAALVIVAVLAVTGPAVSAGPMVLGGDTPSNRLLAVQIFLACTAATGFLLAAVYAESRSSEQAARAEEARIQALADNLPGGMVYQGVRDVDGTMHFLNISAGIQRLCGVSAQAVLKDSAALYGLLVEEDRARLLAAEAASARLTAPFDAVVRLRRPDGELRWMRVASSPRRLADGCVVWDGIQIDITEQHAAGERLRQSEARYRAVTQTANDAILTADDAGMIVGWNQGAQRMFGYTEAEVSGRPLTILMPSRYREQHQTQTDELRFSAEPRSFGKAVEATGLRKDGSEFPVELSRADWETAEGHFFTAIARDITERKQAERTLKDHERHVQMILQTSLDGFQLVDLQGRILEVNDACCAMTGYSREEFLSMRLSDLSADRAGQDVADHIARIVSQGADRFESRHRRKDGRVIDVEMSVNYLDADGGRLVCFCREITARKQAEAELLRTNRQLQEATALANDMAVRADLANEAKSEFLANMSHEIRTPMNGVIGMTGLLLDTKLSDEQRRYAEIVRASGESLLSLINDILDFSKIEANRLEMEDLDFDLLDLLDDFAATLAGRAYDKGLELLCTADPDVPALLRGDPGRLRQVLTNLAGNAIKFTHAGEVVIRTTLASETAGAVVLRFSVRDTGIGIPEDKLGLLFNKFSQVDASTSRQYGGTGLGLAISKRLAEMMGGEIGVHSEVGCGSEFWFTARLGKQPQGRQAAARPFVDLRGVRVLIVDDNTTNRAMLAARLTSWGMRPAEAQDGPAALQALERARNDDDAFRIALVDMQMPGMDGEAVGRAIRADVRLADTRLVMLTSLGAPADARRFETLGFSAYLIKPVRNQELMRALSMAAQNTPRPELQPIETRRDGAGRLAGCAARILVAEDNITNQQVTLGILKKLGLCADAVADGTEAVQAVQCRPYDLVLMDVQMPVLDGYEATRRIRDGEAASSNHGIPIIAMTAHAMQGDREKCLQAGMNDYLSKPVTPQALGGMLERWLDGVEARRRPGESQPVQGTESDAPVFDRQGMLERLMGDEDLVKTVTEAFLEDVPCQIQALRGFIDAEDLAGSERQAHTIKGASASVGGERLREVAFKMEKAARSGDLLAARAYLPDLDEQFGSLQDAMRKDGA